MNFSGIPRSSLLGKILRSFLALIPPRTVVPILQGLLRGKRWVVGAGVHGYWLGSYEFEKQKAIAQYIRQGDIFDDTAANVGLYTLLAAQAAGKAGHVYAFKPLSRNVTYLRRHVALNHFENVTTLELALGDREGIARFHEGLHPSMARISDEGAREVRTCPLDVLYRDEQLCPPVF